LTSAISVKNVAVVGGGISGLSCAQTLRQAGIHTVVFDTGKSYPGGRASTRYITVGDKELIFEHSAQFILTNTQEFQQWCSINDNLMTWDGDIGIISEDISVASMSSKYVGKHGIRSLTESLSKGVELYKDVWVSHLKRDDISGKWNLRNFNKNLGNYDIVIFAHNGKCADNLARTSNINAINNLLRVNFGSAISNPKQMKKMTLCSLYVMVFAIKHPIDKLMNDMKTNDDSMHNFDAYLIKNSNKISWISNTSKKLRRTKQDSPYESWTIISTRDYGTKNKVPQENIPPEKDAQVKLELIEEFEKLLNYAPGNHLQCSGGFVNHYFMSYKEV
jgi:protoporphyrinogen oxidase